MPSQPDPQGRIAENIVYFARALRSAGIPVGPGAVLDALEAVRGAGVGTRDDFYWTLHAVFVKRHEHSVLFDQAFRIFFRKRGYLEQLISMMSPPVPGAVPEAPEKASQRVLDALFSGGETIEREKEQVELDARLTVSDREVLEKKDFAQMGAAEIASAKDAIKRLVLSFDAVATRRLRPDPHGHRIDLRRTLRASMKGGGALIDLKYRGRTTRFPPLVALVDISGSMSQYTRLFLHFLHAMTDARKRVSTFLFGTRLTNVTQGARSRRGAGGMLGLRARLVRRHADRDLARRVQQAMGAARAGAGGGGAADHRRAGARSRRAAGVRDRPAAPLLPPPGLAQPAAAVLRLRGQGARHPDHAAACRRNAADPQPRIDGGAVPGAVGERQPCRSEGLASTGGVMSGGVIYSRT
jgi:uncharacterized protein with von Willebrand factor type A (vWA) domain